MTGKRPLFRINYRLMVFYHTIAWGWHKFNNYHSFGYPSRNTFPLIPLETPPPYISPDSPFNATFLYKQNGNVGFKLVAAVYM
jgi:hypothetical protein